VGAVTPEEPLGRLLAMALSAVVEELHEHLERRGWGPIRPLWGFVLLALREEPRSISEIGGLLGVTKQSAGKVVDGLTEAGLVQRAPNALDRRASAIGLTKQGLRFLVDVETSYAEIESGWRDAIGERRLAAVRTGLADALVAHYGAGRPPLRPVL
jgi:DNA-binding MarR family transcriptional regulator